MESEEQIQEHAPGSVLAEWLHCPLNMLPECVLTSEPCTEPRLLSPTPSCSSSSTWASLRTAYGAAMGW